MKPYETIQLIRKMAQEMELGPPPTRDAPVQTKNVSTTKPTAVPNMSNKLEFGPPVTRETANSVKPKKFIAPTTGLASVKSMQVAMQNLADDVIRDTHVGTMALKPQDSQQPLASPDVAKAKEGFNNFIAEQYIGTLDGDQKGVEWPTSNAITSKQSKTQGQTDIYELDAVMNTMKRLGMGGKEFSVDGHWDWRTDNALKNMMGFAFALLSLEADFGLPNQIYPYASWQSLHQLLSGYQITTDGKVLLSNQDKNDRAEEITKHIKAINNLYNNFRKQVIGRSEFRPLLEGKRSFEKYDSISSQELDTAKQPQNILYGVKFMDGNGKPIESIPMSSLVSRQSFEDYLKTIGYSAEQLPKIAPLLIANIKKQIENK